MSYWFKLLFILSTLPTMLFLASCTNTLEGIRQDLSLGGGGGATTSATISPVSVQPLPSLSTHQTAVIQPMVENFPSSVRPPQGRPWTILHEDSFKGNLQDTCDVLGLSKSECGRFTAMRDSGKCETKILPNGVIADRLGFTDLHGKNRVQHRALVKLKEPNPGALICELDDKFVVIVFKCGNPMRIDKPKVSTRALQVQTAPVTLGCSTDLPLYTHVWSLKELPADLQIRIKDKAAQASVRVRHDRSDDISRGLGGELRQRAAAGEFARNVLPVTVRITLLDDRTGSQMFVSEETFTGGIHTQHFTRGQITGRSIQTIVSAAGGVVSPTVWKGNGQHDLRILSPEWGPECNKNQHIILPG